MTNTTMQAARAHDYGAPETLLLESVERPAPNAAQVLIRLIAAGVNPADWKYLAGYYKQYVRGRVQSDSAPVPDEPPPGGRQHQRQAQAVSIR